MSEMPQHLHFAMGSTNIGSSQTGANNVLGVVASRLYTDPPPQVTLQASTITNIGGSQAHLNMQPYLVLTFIIALQGIFPSQN
jgi:microcystin-dependent protein